MVLIMENTWCIEAFCLFICFMAVPIVKGGKRGGGDPGEREPPGPSAQFVCYNKLHFGIPSPPEGLVQQVVLTGITKIVLTVNN